MTVTGIWHTPSLFDTPFGVIQMNIAYNGFVGVMLKNASFVGVIMPAMPACISKQDS